MQEYSVIVDLISNVGAMGFVFMLVWRTTNHTIPRLARSFEKATKDAQQDFRNILQQQRDDFRDSLREHREFVVRLGAKEL